MRILTWNCNGGFRNKFHALSNLTADVYVIQECEDPSKVKSAPADYFTFSENSLWVGDNKNRGLGVFARKDVELHRTNLNLQLDSTHVKWFLPFSINHQLELVAAWAHRGDGGKFRYIGQFYKLLINNLSSISDRIFLGDFNSNAIWDYKRSEGDHSTCVRILESVGTHSLYHWISREQHGCESSPTFRLQKNPHKPYHIDYIFSPLQHIQKTKSLSVGNFDDWVTYSDHVPLIWEFDLIQS